MTSILIRPYTKNDWEELTHTFNKNVPQYFAQDEIFYLQKHLHTYQETYYIATIEKKIVGAGGYYLTSNHSARLSWYFIDTTHQKKGIGRSLVLYALKQIEKLTIYKIEVWTSQFASDFFANFGFVLIETKDNYWAPGIHLHKMKMENN